MSELLSRLQFGRARVLQGWTQGAYCRDADGYAVCTDSASAVVWCALGAAGATLYFIKGLEVRAALKAALPRSYLDSLCCIDLASIDHFNDLEETTQADVVALYDRAITAESARVRGQDGPYTALFDSHITEPRK